MMQVQSLLTDQAVLGELGGRLARHRLERNLTQGDLAELAGVGRATLQRIEGGRSVQTTSIVKVLRALDLLGGLDAAIPEQVEMPIARLAREGGRGRQRARRRAEEGGGPARWEWGGEQEQSS